MFSLDVLKRAENLTDEEAKKYGKVELIPVDKILEDPDNRMIYGDYESDGLSESITKNGFHGVVLLYPVSDGYCLQSGHRTLEAAKKAGLLQIPALIGEKPESEVERRKNLLIPNLHHRDNTPMRMARMIQYHFDTLRMEQEEQGEKGWNLTEMVAKDMEISTAMVTKYRALLKLIPELQNLADNRSVSWSSLSAVSTTEPAIQKIIYQRIIGKAKVSGYDAITRAWLDNEIRECRHIRIPEKKAAFTRDTLYPSVEQETHTSKAGRKISRKTALKHALSYLEKAIAAPASSEAEEKDCLSLVKLLKSKLSEFDSLE